MKDFGDRGKLMKKTSRFEVTWDKGSIYKYNNYAYFIDHLARSDIILNIYNNH